MGVGGEAALSRYNEFQCESAFDRCNEGPFFRRYFVNYLNRLLVLGCLTIATIQNTLCRMKCFIRRPPKDSQTQTRKNVQHIMCNELAPRTRHVSSPKGHYAGTSTKLLMRCQARNDGCGNLFRSRWLESRNGRPKGDLTSQVHGRG